MLIDTFGVDLLWRGSASGIRASEWEELREASGAVRPSVKTDRGSALWRKESLARGDTALSSHAPGPFPVAEEHSVASSTSHII